MKACDDWWKMVVSCSGSELLLTWQRRAADSISRDRSPGSDGEGQPAEPVC